MKKGFTLAEVLITLGIIGVVAAMTLPTLINNYRVKVLETNFKKADSIITQAMQSTMFEYGFTRYYDFGNYCKGENCANTSFEDFNDINATFKDQFKGIVKIVNKTDLDRAKYQGFGFWGEKSAGYYYGNMYGIMRPNKKGFMLQDQMLISEIDYITGSAVEVGDNSRGRYTIVPYIFVDTNGPAKGPNRLGYDLFYYIHMTCYFTGCDPVGTNSYKLNGCYLWARKDQNPYDTSVSYWKSLYKPKSYWEKLKNK